MLFFVGLFMRKIFVLLVVLFYSLFLVNASMGPVDYVDEESLYASSSQAGASPDLIMDQVENNESEVGFYNFLLSSRYIVSCMCCSVLILGGIALSTG